MGVKGYCGKLLRVNLTSGEVKESPLPEESVLRDYIGGIGLGMKLIWDEVDPSVQASDPESPLMFLTGPLTGTSAPSSSNLAVVCLNFNTPHAVATGHTHGYWAAYLKHAGYDGIIFTGQSEKPVYLWVDDDNIEIRDASMHWGNDTRDTERLIKRELGDEEKISVACIGPAGEAMLHGGSIKNDRNHGASKGSVGAVMGSKRLKAVAVRGTKPVELADSSTFAEVTQVWQDSILKDPKPGEGEPALAKLVADGGITRGYHHVGDANMLAGKNLTDPEWGKKFTHGIVDAGKEWTITPKESYNCSIACSYDCRIDTGKYKGYTASLCGGGENVEGAAGLVGIEDPAEAIIMTDYMDGLGMDTAVGGALMGMAFELFNRGIITEKETGGLDLTWGNFESAQTLLDQMCSGEGFGGEVLAKGLKEAAAILGPEAEQCVLHIRGGGYNMHDWRTAWSVLLGQIVTAGAGACWQGPGVDTWTTEPDLGYTEFSDPFETKGKAEAVSKTQIKKLWEDTLGICWFACWGVGGVIERSSKAIALATGWEDFDSDEAMRVGERMANIQRMIALKRGLKPEDVYDVSPRLLEAPKNGKAAGKSIKPHLSDMVEEYYELMGWDKETGHPTQETLERVGLGNL